MKRFTLSLLLITILVVFSSSLVFALTPPSGGVSYYNFSSVSDLWGSYDGTNNGATSSTSYPSFNTSGNSAPSSYSFDSSNDYVDFGDINELDGVSAFSISFWGNIDTLEDYTGIFEKYVDNNNRIGLGMSGAGLGDNNDFLLNLANGNNYYGYSTSDILSTNNWFHAVMVFNGSGSSNADRLKLYVNGSSVSLTFVGTIPSSTDSNTAVLNFGRGNGANYADGLFDSIKVFNKSLSSTEVSNIYNYGSITAPIPSPTNESTEHTAIVKQVGITQINTGIYATVLSSTESVPVNTTGYLSYTYNIDSNLDNSMFCRLQVNGTTIETKTRSNIKNHIGSVQITSENLTFIENINYTVDWQCLVSGGGKYNLFNGVGVTHLMYDENNNSIPYVFESITGSTSSSTLTKIGELNITTGNQTPTTNVTHNIVLEGDAEYFNYAGSREELYLELRSSHFNCSGMPRSVDAGNVGNTAYDCILHNVTNSTTYTIEVYANGSNANYDLNLHAKDLFLHTDEILGGIGLLDSYSFQGETFTKIANLTGGNSNHPTSNIVSRLSFSIKANESTTAKFYTRLSNGNNYTSKNFTRYVDTNTGVIIGQDIFEDIPSNTYQAEIWASCPNANCTILGGSSPGYLTDITSVIVNAFDVRAFNSWDNSSIANFNVTNGGTVTSVNGTATVTIQEDVENLTISASDYFSTNILNHNTSNDLNISLNQSFINFSAHEVFSNASISGVTFEVSDGVVTRNFTGVANLKEGSYTVTPYKVSYLGLPVSFNVSALDNKTIYVEGLYTSNVTIIPRTIISNASLSGLNITIYAVNGASRSWVNVSNTSLPLVNGSSYTLVIDGEDIALYNESFSPSATGNTVEYVYVYSYNSLWIYAKDQSTLNNISSFNVTVQNEDHQYTASNTSGKVMIDNIMSGSYTVLVASSGYVTNEYTITMDENSHQELISYLANTTNEVNFIVKGSDDNKLLEGVLISQKKFVGGVLTTIASALTDVVGEVSFAYEDDVIYTFTASKTGYNIKTFTLAPSSPEYILLLDKSISINPSVYVDDVVVTIYDSNIKNVASAEIRVGFNSGGSLTDYFVNMSFNGSSDYVSGSSATGSVLTSTLNLSGATIGDTVVVSYGYKSSVNADYVYFSKVYIIDSWSYVDVSFENSRDFFDSYGALEKAILGTILIFLFAGILGSGASLMRADLIISGSLGGLLGAGLSLWFGFFTTEIFIAVSFVLGMIIISSLRGKA